MNVQYLEQLFKNKRMSMILVVYYECAAKKHINNVEN